MAEEQKPVETTPAAEPVVEETPAAPAAEPAVEEPAPAAEATAEETPAVEEAAPAAEAEPKEGFPKYVECARLGQDASGC
jgi:hypothetical protein